MHLWSAGGPRTRRSEMKAPASNVAMSVVRLFPPHFYATINLGPLNRDRDSEGETAHHSGGGGGCYGENECTAYNHKRA